MEPVLVAMYRSMRINHSTKCHFEALTGLKVLLLRNIIQKFVRCAYRRAQAETVRAATVQTVAESPRS